MGARSRPARAEPGKAPDSSAASATKVSSESRKLRNRLSQKAFRARQAMRIKELEERLDQEPTSDAARTAQLQDRNAALRNQLLDCHKKIASLQISMKTLADSTALALGIENLEDPQPKGLCRRCQRHEDSDDNQLSPDEGYASHTSRPDLDLLEEEACDQGDSTFHDIQIPENVCSMDGSMDDAQQLIHPGETQVENIDLLDNNQTFVDQEQVQISALNLDFYSPQDHFSSLAAGQAGQVITGNGNSNFIPAPQFPLNFSFKEMGFDKYADLVQRSPHISPCSSVGLRRTNSLFSDHLSAVEYFLQQKWLKRCPDTFNDDQFSESIKFMISAFVSVSWQTMTAWHTYTKAHVPLKDLTAWRVKQTPEAYMKIIPSYRPTQLQMSTQHPAIIDWIPWASLRDKLIIYHSANPCLDNIVCDIGNSYVVPTDLSKLVAGLPPMLGYISVWDLVRAIAPDATSPESDASQEDVSGGSMDYFSTSNGTCAYDSDAIQNIVDEDDEVLNGGASLPAPDSKALFSSKSLAIQAFKVLGMDKGAATFCLDPEFFGRHPELYDPQCDIMARGVPLRPSRHLSIPIPRELNSSVLGQYRELTRWSFDHTPEG